MMKMFGKLALAVMAVSMIGVMPASAFGPGGLSRPAGAVVRNIYLAEARQTAAPFGHVLFCSRNPEECARPQRSRWGRAPVILTAAKKALLDDVNRSVNRSIIARNDDPNILGGDSWALAPKAGDCEDFALTKRHQLIASGWPARTLRLAVTNTAFGEGHLVLVVKTNEGDVVLDNRLDKVRKWNRTGLKWRMIQASIDPRRWYSI